MTAAGLGGEQITSWSLGIADELDQPVRVASGDGPPPETWVWNGQDGQGTVVDDGDYFYRLSVTAEGGSSTTTNPAGTVTVDTTDPGQVTITSPADGSATRDGLMTVEGTGEPGTKVTLRDNGQIRAQPADVGENGEWQVHYFPLDGGDNTLIAFATDEAGNEGAESTAVHVQVVVGEPLLDVGGHHLAHGEPGRGRRRRRDRRHLGRERHRQRPRHLHAGGARGPG